MPPLTLLTEKDREEVSRRSDLLPNQKDIRQQQALSPCLLPTSWESRAHLTFRNSPTGEFGLLLQAAREGNDAHGEAEGLAKLKAQLLDVLSSSCSALGRWAGEQIQLNPFPIHPRVRTLFTPLAFNYTA